jgi:hypothetical protein
MYYKKRATLLIVLPVVFAMMWMNTAFAGASL